LSPALTPKIQKQRIFQQPRYGSWAVLRLEQNQSR
jgi:hypothetical protein